ncbi:MAG: hypothetical protein ABJB74_20755 [Gemmatimonas sp.]
MNITRVVIAGHGSFATGIISAVEQISGKGDLFVPVSSIGLRGVDIDVVLLQTLNDHHSNILFTDLPAGSCTMSARRLQRSRPGLVLVTGVNLGTVLEFAFRSADASDVDAAKMAIEKGRATMSVFP